MNNLYQGGQCNPNAVGATSNSFKGMMGQLSMGNQNAERIVDHQSQGKNFENQIAEREAMFKNMNQQWSASDQAVKQSHQNLQQQMSGQFDEAAMIEQQRMLQMQRVHQMEWENAEQRKMHEQQMLNKQFEMMKMQQDAEHWKNEALMEEAFTKAELTYDQEQKNIHNSSESMLNVMMNDEDPRFQNSQFLHFLKRINKGELVISGKEITEVKPDSVSMEQTFKEAESKQSELQKGIDEEYKNAQMKVKQFDGQMQENFVEAQKKQAMESLNAQKMMEQNWQQRLQEYEKQYGDHQNFEKMLEQKYMEVLNEMNIDLTEAWQASTNLQEELVHGDAREKYAFSENNPYLDVAFPKTLALELINQGKNNEAILALEAHLLKNQSDGESWRILGRILQENDQDQKGVTCFMNCLKTNPQNLDCLLSLGVSCTNTLDEVKAMNYLKQWLIFNPKYANIKVNPNIVPEQEQITYKVEQVKEMNHNMIETFKQAVAQEPNDPQLYSAMGILFFLKRDYEAGIEFFKRALHLDPTNYLLLNKVGATVAHLGRADDAIDMYQRALDIRPNYVRAWVNLGIAHAFKGQYHEAVRFYLNALSFRPDAKHIWSYLHTCFMSLQRYDLINKISSQDVRVFMKDFDILQLGQLPEPDIPYKITTEKHILNKMSEDWLNETKK